MFTLGFLALFTIGGSKHQLAHPLKITISWELLTIILLMFLINILVTMYYFEQSAGNQQIMVCTKNHILVGSSETKCNPHKKIMGRYSPLNNKSMTTQNSKLPFVLKNTRLYSTVKGPSVKVGSSSASPTGSITTNKIEEKIGKDNLKNISPLMTYKNFKEDRTKIFKDQNNKSGVYCFINNINGHSYVGSSINLKSRMKNYLNNTFLKNEKNINMPIAKALLKYDQSNFSLLIIEHVEAEVLTIRETFFITSIIPYYNVLKQGYSSLGYKHTEETKILLSELQKNRKHSELTKSLIAKALVGENNPFYNKNHSMESKVRMIEANSLYPVYIYNSNKVLLVIFPSVLTLAKKLNSNHSTIVNFIKNKNLFRGE